jgi:hypothetical protein
VLAILSDNEKKNSVVEPEATDSQAGDQMIDIPEEPFISDVPGNGPGETDEVISDVQSQSQKISDLLEGARSNIGELKLTSPLGNNAYEKYQTVLNLEPNNPEAMNGMDRIVDEYIDLMDFALGKNDIPRARNYLRKGMNINSEHYGVADAERRLNAAVEANENQIRENKLREQEAMRRQQEQEKRDLEQQMIQEEKKEQKSLISDTDRQKLEQLKQRLRSNPKDKRARKELKKIGEKYQKKIETALKGRDFDLAEDYVLEIMEITPERSKGYKELTETLGKIRARKYEYNNQ